MLTHAEEDVLLLSPLLLTSPCDKSSSSSSHLSSAGSACPCASSKSTSLSTAARHLLSCWIRVFAAALLACGVWLVVDRYFAFYQTSSVVPHSYEWHSLPHAIHRQYRAAGGAAEDEFTAVTGTSPSSVDESYRRAPLTAPPSFVNWTHICPSTRRRAFPTAEQLQGDISRLLQQPLQRGAGGEDNGDDAPPLPVLRVHVTGDFVRTQPLSFLWSHVLSSTTRSYHSPDCSRFHAASNTTSADAPTEERVFEDDTSPSVYQCVYLPSYRLELVLIPFPPPAADMASIRHLIIVGEVDLDFFVQATPLLRPPIARADLTLGMVAIGREDCNFNGTMHALSDIHPGLRFALFTYGECRLVDNVAAFVWPLGTPTLEGAFPFHLQRALNPPVAARPVLLNLMASFTVEKPTRRQAFIAAEEVCAASALECVLTPQADGASWWQQLRRIASPSASPTLYNSVRSLFAVPTFVPLPAAGNGSDAHHAATSRYVRTLRSSVFTLCPMGGNVESFRIWEALLCGSIPVVEDYPHLSADEEPLWWFHPKYGGRYACQHDQDSLHWLKTTQAPVLWVRQDWRRELRGVHQQFLAANSSRLDLGRVEQRHREVSEWFDRLLAHMQLLLVSQILRTMQRD